MSLSERERRFVEAFKGQACGNATKAAEIAGYSPKAARQQASRLLTKANIQAALEEVGKDDPLVADRIERQRFLSGLMRDGGAHPLARLKACDQLAKTQGDYIERTHLTGELTHTAKVIHEHRERA